MCRDELVGTAILAWRDGESRTLGGTFEPGPGYAAVAPVFELFAVAGGDRAQLAAYYERRDALDLTILDETGEIVDGVVHIVDFSTLLEDAPLEIEILPPDVRR